MKKLYAHLFFIFFILMGTSINAQDLHFAQYYTFAQQLNPALTGNFDGSYRVAVIYRNQWSSFLDKDAFVTPGVAIDVPLLEGQLKKDKLGIGLMFVNDRFGQGSLTTLNAAFSLAYHKGLGKDGKHRISLGGQVGYVQKTIDSDGFVFYDQFDEVSHTGEGVSQDVFNLERGNYHFFDYNFGIYWKSSFNDRFRMQGGASVFHMSEPTEWYIKENDDFFLPRRYLGDLGFEVFLTKKLSLAPDALYQQQGQFQEIMTGASLGYYFNSGFRDNSSFHVGARYRFSQQNADAIVTMASLEFRNVSIGAAYDINLSELNAVSSKKGAFEVSLVYVGESIRTYKANKSLPARRF
ncbi:MAG: PorP/SprF family type IX secretion system membrane protein [Chitinophagales bacterium]